MKIIALIVLLASCKIVTNDGTGTGANAMGGLYYRCEWVLHGEPKHQNVCGPQPPDPDYVVQHFMPTFDANTRLTCTVTIAWCIWARPDDVDAGITP